MFSDCGAQAQRQAYLWYLAVKYSAMHNFIHNSYRLYLSTTSDLYCFDKIIKRGGASF